MHHFRSRKAPVILWICCVNLLVAGFGVAGGMVAGVCGAMLADSQLLGMAAVLLGTGLAASGLHLTLSHRVRCPLCHGALLQNAGCARHAKADRACGSVRLGLVWRVLRTLRFRCPYCGESCACGTRGGNPAVVARVRHHHHAGCRPADRDGLERGG